MYACSGRPFINEHQYNYINKHSPGEKSIPLHHTFLNPGSDKVEEKHLPMSVKKKLKKKQTSVDDTNLSPVEFITIGLT